MVVRALCLCEGYGGFELGLREHGIRTVARVERDSYAAAVLVERMETSRLDPAPVWDDLTTFDGSAWRGRVDLITAGFPCQPFSAAGQRKGVDDDRWLWPAIGRIIRDVGPSLVFLENVPGLVRHGLPHVLADLAALGFDAEWGLLAAADVGAPHRRQRFWLLAHANEPGRQRVYVGRTGKEAEIDSASKDVGYARRLGRPEVTGSAPSNESPDGWGSHGGDFVDGASEDVADTASARRDIGRRQTIKPPEIGRRRTPNGSFPPRPDDRHGWEQWATESGPQPSIRRSTDGPPLGLADALHLGGNGLVPQCATEAFRQLCDRLNS